MGQHGVADESLSAPHERRALLMVHDGITGVRTYLSTGVSTLVAIMAAHADYSEREQRRAPAPADEAS
jgi:hypothetical protein